MPLFTIGITTFRRPEMLRECVESIRQQTYEDFEVLIGNDDTTRLLDGGDIGSQDHRIRILNHKKNLGELRNMNRLLEEATGKYFTWLADDDFLNRNALASVSLALNELHFPDSLLTFYRSTKGYQGENRAEPCRVRPIKVCASEFLEKLFREIYPIAGCYGYFKTDYLREKGGIRQLGTGFSPCSDSLLAVEEARNEHVFVLPFETSFIRRHEGSISYTTTDLESFESALIDYRKECRKVIFSKHAAIGGKKNFRLLCLVCVYHFASVLQRSKLPLYKSVRSLRFFPPMLGDPLGFVVVGFAWLKTVIKIVFNWLGAKMGYVGGGRK